MAPQDNFCKDPVSWRMGLSRLNVLKRGPDWPHMDMFSNIKVQEAWRIGV